MYSQVEFSKLYAPGAYIVYYSFSTDYTLIKMLTCGSGLAAVWTSVSFSQLGGPEWEQVSVRVEEELRLRSDLPESHLRGPVTWQLYLYIWNLEERPGIHVIYPSQFQNVTSIF